MPDNLIDWKKNSTMVFKTEIEIEYVHQLKELYKRIHQWLEENNFKDFHGRQDYETLYWQRDLPNGLSEHHFWWRAHKHPGVETLEQKDFTWFIKLNYQTIAVSKAEVMHKGKKWKLHQSNTILRYEAYLIFNWEKEWEGQPFLGKLQTRWKQWIYRPRWKEVEQQLIDKMMEFTNTIKAFLELTKSKEIPPDTGPPNALP